MSTPSNPTHCIVLSGSVVFRGTLAQATGELKARSQAGEKVVLRTLRGQDDRQAIQAGTYQPATPRQAVQVPVYTPEALKAALDTITSLTQAEVAAGIPNYRAKSLYQDVTSHPERGVSAKMFRILSHWAGKIEKARAHRHQGQAAAQPAVETPPWEETELDWLGVIPF